MRVCHVGVEIVPTSEGAFVGGLVKNVVTLAKRQAEQGHEPEIVTSNVNNSIENGQRLSYGRVHRVNTWGRYGSMAFAATFIAGAALEIRSAHRRRPFDIVHVHSAYSSLGTIANLLKGVKVPKIFSLYSPNLGFWPGHYCRGPSLLSRRLTKRYSLEAFDATIVPSANLRAHLTSLGIREEKVAQIPPALAPAMFDPLPSREKTRKGLNIPRDSPVVLYVGNYSPWKGIEVLLRAIERIRRDFPDVILLTAWGEPYQWSGNRRGSILALIDRLGLGDVVRQVGIVEDVRRLYRAADTLVSPLQCTCKVLDYPLSILEAMACERPVISTTVGGIPEIVGRDGHGVLVEPRDVSSLTEAIEMLLREPRVALSMGRRGSKWVYERFRPESVWSRLEALYTQLREVATSPS